MTNTQMDFMLNGQFKGDVATYMAANGRIDPGVMRPFISEKSGEAFISIHKGGDRTKPENYAQVPHTHATLRRDEWNSLDSALLGISESRLGGVQDLLSKGLVYNIGNAMGTTVLEYHDVSDALNAEMTMDGVTRTKGDRPNYSSVYLPIPIIHADYEINARALTASRNLGNALDTTLAERAGRKVMEKLEDMLFTSTTYAFGGGTIYSYLNHPDRNLVTFSNYGHWDDSASTSASILASVLAMKQASINAYHYGPWMLYIPTAFETVLDGDYDVTTPGTTIRERILKISGIQGIKVVDTLTADNVLLVQMTSDVVRLVRGMGLTNVEWATEGNMIHKYKVMTIQVPQVRSDQEGNSGIVHMA